MPKTATKPLLFLFGLFLFLASFTSNAQNETEVSLYKVILNLERAHEILFSYVIDEVSDYMITPPSETLNLEESIQYLNSNTAFHFEKISDRYYSVAKVRNEPNTLGAYIIDNGSGEPLENASVSVTGAQFNTVSDKNGRFFIPKQYANNEIQISHIGFHTLVISGAELSKDVPKLLMLPSISSLNEVLISGILVKGINRNVDGSTSLNTNNFGLLPGQTENDVLQIAQALPGVESINETISTINIRGGTNDENLILWEGLRMYQIGHFFGLISAFNPNLTKDLTVYKNGTPARFGESVSGVISMASNNDIAKNFRGGIGANLINANAFLELPINEKVGLQISGRSSINGIFQSPVYSNFSDRIFQDTEITNNQNSESFTEVLFQEDFYFFDVGGKVLWDPTEKDRVRVNFIAMENHFEFSERLLESEETSRLEQKSEAAGISWEREWTDRFETNLAIQATHYLLKAVNQDIFTFQEINQENQVLDLEAKLDTKLRLSNLFELKSGYHFSEIGISNIQDVNLPRFRDYEKNVLRSHIAYGNLIYRTDNKKTRIDAGVRGNYFEKFSEVLVEPRLYVYQELLPGFALEVLGEFKSQTLTQRIDLQSDFLGIEKRRWVLANNNDVPIKKSRQASLGFLYHKKGWFINLEGFIKNVENITSKSQGFQNQFQFETALGNYSVTGAEFTINKKISDLSIWMSYGFGKNDYDFTSFTPSEFPNNIDVRHTLTVASSYNWNAFKFALGLNWHSGRPYTVPKTDAPPIFGEGFLTIDYSDPNEERLNDYLRVDFSAEYLWKISSKVDAVFNLALLNMTNQDNTLNIRYALEDPADIDSDINRIEESSLGFTPNFSVQVLF